MANPVPLEYGRYYHIYNRGNNRANLFVAEHNYRYFLKLYAQHVEPVADTYAYCLLPNHFHLLVQIKDLADPGPRKTSQYFSNLFNAYAKAFNRAQGRTGALFQRPFGRIPVTSDAYLGWLVIYIHQNPQKHGLVPGFDDWRHSSYHAHLSQQPTRLRRDDVLDWFDGPVGFRMSHTGLVPGRQVVRLVPEDFD
jgi:REP element-mobilizing transposase RayT